jgi:hypothetical protein
LRIIGAAQSDPACELCQRKAIPRRDQFIARQISIKLRHGDDYGARAGCVAGLLDSLTGRFASRIAALAFAERHLWLLSFCIFSHFAINYDRYADGAASREANSSKRYRVIIVHPGPYRDCLVVQFRLERALH